MLSIFYPAWRCIPSTSQSGKQSKACIGLCTVLISQQVDKPGGLKGMQSITCVCRYIWGARSASWRQEESG